MINDRWLADSPFEHYSSSHTKTTERKTYYLILIIRYFGHLIDSIFIHMYTKKHAQKMQESPYKRPLVLCPNDLVTINKISSSSYSGFHLMCFFLLSHYYTVMILQNSVSRLIQRWFLYIHPYIDYLIRTFAYKENRRSCSNKSTVMLYNWFEFNFDI